MYDLLKHGTPHKIVETTAPNPQNQIQQGHELSSGGEFIFAGLAIAIAGLIAYIGNRMSQNKKGRT